MRINPEPMGASELAAEHVEDARRILWSWARGRGLPTWMIEELEGDALLELVLLARDFDGDRNDNFGGFLCHRLPLRLIDVLRRRYGRTNRRSGKSLTGAFERETVLDDLLVFIGIDEDGYDEVDAELSHYAWARLARDGRDLTILGLIASGRRQSEISRELGLSESRVGQLVRRMQRRAQDLAA